ncbi:response regulator [Adhaeretor mobilis]|uniref:Acetoacetate metabolism regulatory protein AtoC n=1 Tax=Adhaeretor mobilis TaxID=1930276 RepID=A0A517MT69_9BACT|nr:response regulator [Adhaeretor mobilis]QDS98073.1 acetoacetate metabolism regulatory protein AtoC [Adhaeretor mobilis]
MPTTTSATTDIRVVDPRPDDYSQLAAELAASEVRIHIATSGEEALRLPAMTGVGLWLINFKLPDMTGVELLSQICERDRNSACVLISDIYSAADEIQARHAGATLYGCKPPQAAWFSAMPALQRLDQRDHLAHGPPRPRASSARISTPIVDAAVRSKPDS